MPISGPTLRITISVAFLEEAACAARKAFDSESLSRSSPLIQIVLTHDDRDINNRLLLS